MPETGINWGAVAEWLRETNGYSILKPEFFTGLGFEPAVVERYTHDHAGGEGKYAAIAPDGTIAETCVGVSEFSFIAEVCKSLGVEPYWESLGRGRNFRESKARCLRALKARGVIE